MLISLILRACRAVVSKDEALALAAARNSML
jgi:hypothetical protein